MIDFLKSPWTISIGSVIVFLILSICFYKYGFKRFYDLLFSFIGLVLLSPVFVILAILTRIKLGKPIIFGQIRPGKKNKVFKMYKFRTMTNETNASGKLLTDEERMTSFGRFLRSTSMDEIPELWNIFIGKMSLIGPRPQLVKDLVFMNDEIKKRHSVRGGLTGLAQVKGRNGLNWDERFKYDLEYVNHISFFGDIKIFFLTILAVLKKDGIATEGMETSEDYGDWLLRSGKITIAEYDDKIESIK